MFRKRQAKFMSRKSVSSSTQDILISFLILRERKCALRDTLMRFGVLGGSKRRSKKHRRNDSRSSRAAASPRGDRRYFAREGVFEAFDKEQVFAGNAV